MKIAINGFGRIGRSILRIALQRTPFQIVAINDLTPKDTSLHLLKYDSIHGILKHSVTAQDQTWDVGCGKIRIFQEKDPSNLPWKDMGIDVVLECSGKFLTKEGAGQHLRAGAKKVLVSAPMKDPELTVVYGVNHKNMTPSHTILSNASCTTNCLAPVVKCLHEAFGIEHGHMTTIHSYTGDQSLIDTNHHDLRRARAATLSMIPSSTGAAQAVGLVLPELKGRLDGTAIRVPTSNVSVVDLTCVLQQKTSREEVNELFIQASKNQLRGILAVENKPLVSIDFLQNSNSSIVDLGQTNVIGKTLCRVLAWYDNEWGFSHRMLDVAEILGNI